MSDELEIRVSDVEREQAVARLRGSPTPATPRIRVNGVSILAPVFVKHRRS